MLDKFREMKGKRFLCFLFALSFTNTLVIWITLTSRNIDSVQEVILMPFKSYMNAFSGNKRMLLENIENIIMFIPFGFLVPHLFHIRKKKVIIVGFVFSLIIETLQLGLGLGTFEVDDLINNSLGSVVGAWIAHRLQIKAYIYDKRATVLLIGLLSAAMLCLTNSGKIIYSSFHQDRMVTFASMGDDDGKRNLLVLDGKDGYAFGTKMYVEYQKDGTISIVGHSDKRAWYLLGEQTLPTGSYVFKGLSGIQKETIAIELEYFDAKEDKFLRLTPDVGSIDEAEFVLDKSTVIRTYVGVYPVGESCVIAKPVIYKLGD